MARGGHDIPKNLILKRYDDSRRNLLESLKFADNVYIIDNSLDFRLNLVIKNGKILEIKNPLDEWVKDLKDEIEVKLKRT